jgi:uncharacterized protein YdhG (YjbR/CyaY superfamily)
MATSKATDVESLLAELPPERAAVLKKLREAVNAGLPEGYQEGVQYGMIGWCVPHSRYPAGYHCDPKQPLPFASIAAQKQYYSVYLMGIYMVPSEEAWFTAAYAKTGKKLDMGKSCIRFKKEEDIPFELITEAIGRLSVDQYLAAYIPQIPASKSGKKK